MYVAMNRFGVAPGREADFESAWVERESHLDQVPGFLTFALLRGEAGVFISHSTWESEAAFSAWTESDAFARAHRQRLPEGVLAGPPEFAGYRVVLSQGASGVGAASA